MTYLVPLEGATYEESGRVMVISHNCEVEKGLLRKPTWPMSIAPMILIDDLPRGEPKIVRAGDFLRYWELPEDPPLEEGWAVDLDLIQPTLVATVQAGVRVASIDDDGKKVLMARIMRLLALREVIAGLESTLSCSLTPPAPRKES